MDIILWNVVFPYQVEIEQNQKHVDSNAKKHPNVKVGPNNSNGAKSEQDGNCEAWHVVKDGR